MDFREATDILCAKLGHEDLARKLGVSVQAVRQARLKPGAYGQRPPPAEWKHAVIRLAEERIVHYANLITAIQSSLQSDVA